MKIMLDAFWRAVAYCLHPRVILLSLLPLLLMVLAGLAFAQWGWWPVVDAVRLWLDGTAVQTVIDQGFDWLGVPQFKSVVPALVVVVLVTPLIVILSLLAVATLMTPALVKMVGARRFPDLERRHGAGFFGSLGWSLGHTLLALMLLMVSIPLWFLPPLMLVVPPLIWGWLTYRVMSFDVLAEHASKTERIAILREHRGWLLGIGILTGYLGAAPSIVWASGTLFAAAFVILAPVAIWIYTLVFAFSSLWFAHYALAALERLRAAPEAPPPFVASEPLALRDEPPAQAAAAALPTPPAP